MRVGPIAVVGIAVTGVAIGVALAEPDAKNPFDSKPATKPAVLDNTSSVALEKPDQPAEPKPKAKPSKADKLAAHKKLATIKPEPNEYTNDPVLGKANRIHGEETTGYVTFTFDDGPNPDTTPAVLDALKQYNVPGTFFVVTRRLIGKHGEKPRAILARTLAEGHVVASHSVSHPYLGKATDKLLDREIDQSFKTLSEQIKQPIGMFRAPFGALNAAGRARLKKLGVTEAFWSIDTLDWQATKSDKLRKKTFDMIIKQKGGVVLMHDVKPITAKVIADVLDDLEAENCARLARKHEPIWPVTIHYFLRDGKTRRPVPEAVAKQTEAYKQALPERCAKRPPPPKPDEAKPKAAAKPPVGDFGRDPGEGKLPKQDVKVAKKCLDNPVATGCN